MDADRVIEKLGLVPLEQEGGMFCRTYESTTSATGGMPACAAIYYLLRGDDFATGSDALHFANRHEHYKAFTKADDLRRNGRRVRKLRREHQTHRIRV